jgi:hypothetical protein
MPTASFAPGELSQLAALAHTCPWAAGVAPPRQYLVAACALPANASIPTASATPAATDNRFPIADNHPRFLLPVCFLMRFVSCLCVFVFAQIGLTGLTGLTDLSLQLLSSLTKL